MSSSKVKEREYELVQEDLEEVMRKYDRESNVRVWTGKPALAVKAILIGFSLLCIWVTLFATFLEEIRLTSFMGLIIMLGFLTYPAKKGEQKVNYIPWYDIVGMVLGTGAFLYYTFNAEQIIQQGTRFTSIQILIAIVGVAALLEVTRRSVGWPILIVALFFIVYAIVYGLTNPSVVGRLRYLVRNLFYAKTGILSTPINVCSKYIVVFIIFGAFLERTGISEFFINMANCAAGRYAGGPAKVAVISSALCGMVSGSSVGNTVTTGSVTIPMMKETGYKAEFAGAVEAAASTGGQIMPPIMGAAAFLMADIIGVPYSDILVRAILPAILYFTGIFIAVHLEAKKYGLTGIPESKLPKFSKLIRKIYLLTPLILLVIWVSNNMMTMQRAAAYSIIAAIVVGIVDGIFDGSYRTAIADLKRDGSKNPFADAIIGDNEDTGNCFTVRKFFDSLEAGGKGTITVGAACGVAGIISGTIRSVPDYALLHRSRHGRSDNGYLLHHGSDLRSDPDPYGCSDPCGALLRFLLRHCRGYHPACCPGGLCRQRDREIEPHAHSLQRDKARDCGFHHSLRILLQPRHAADRDERGECRSDRGHFSHRYLRRRGSPGGISLYTYGSH